MSISIQTNYASLVAADNLNKNNNFLTSTIEQLTSGYRINQSGDDPAGLAVANGYNSSIAELTQGVLNANDGTSALQIADGGLSNITQILNQLKTLATESSSSTFTGDRSEINVEYQALLTDISRQAANIGLNSGGSLNVANTVYIGGGSDQANAQVAINLSGAQNTVDAVGLGIANTTVAGGGTTFGVSNTVDLNNTANTFISGNASASQTFTFQVATATGAQQVSAVVNGSVAGITGDNVISQLNQQLNQYGISASIAADGTLQFGGQTAFTVDSGAIAGGGTAGSVAAVSGLDAVNTADYNLDSSSAPGGAFVAFASGATETVTFSSGQGSQTLTLDDTNAGGLGQAVSYLNTQLNSIGIYAVSTNAGNISFQSASSFTADEVNYTANGGTGNLFGGATGQAAGSTGAVTVTAPTASASDTGNALAAITAIDGAIKQLGKVQSVVGAGELLLTYATNLANSQITNYSAASGRILDADVATEASNLSKAQVIEQSSVAAIAQANAAPQALLKLLQ